MDTFATLTQSRTTARSCITWILFGELVDLIAMLGDAAHRYSKQLSVEPRRI